MDVFDYYITDFVTMKNIYRTQVKVFIIQIISRISPLTDLGQPSNINREKLRQKNIFHEKLDFQGFDY